DVRRQPTSIGLWRWLRFPGARALARLARAIAWHVPSDYVNSRARRIGRRADSRTIDAPWPGGRRARDTGNTAQIACRFPVPNGRQLSAELDEAGPGMALSVLGGGPLRATPLAQAASRVARATTSATRVSNMPGMMYSSFSSSGPINAAMARAAASFMASLMSVASTSRAPRNTPGNTSELLIWFG